MTEVDPMRGVSEIADWVRQVIEGDKAKAETVAGDRRSWCRNFEGDVMTDSSGGNDYVAVGPWAGVMEDADAEHIATHDPRDTIARFAAELALLDRCERVIRAKDHDKDANGMCLSNPTARYLARHTIRTLASGYQHRDGWKEEWRP